MNCPKCGKSLVKCGFKIKRNLKVQRYQCPDGHIIEAK